MIKTKFVFAISMVSILAVNVANAKIAATSYVDEGVQTATDAAGAAQISADTANAAAGKAQKSADDAQESADAAAESAALALTTLTSKEDSDNKATSFDDESASDEKYPSTGAVKQYVSSATSAINTDIDTVKTALGGKQATISDLATIRSGAAAGATALQKADITTGTSNGTISVDGTNVAVKGLGTAAYTASTAYATSAQGTLADSAVQPGDLADVATSGSYNDLTDTPTIPSGALASKSTITNADVADNAAIAQSKISGLTTALGGKQATISDLATIRSGAEAGATALQKADITTGSSNGTISVEGTNVAVRGLGTAAYTASTAYATAEQGTLASSAVQPEDLAKVATSGSYKDLTDTPTIPSGALASKSTITNADVADNAEIAQSKISGLTTALNAKLASVSSSGTGSVVKAVAKDGTAVKATLGYIGSSDITDGSITSADIKDASIVTADIADGAVTTAKIAASAVTSAKIADGAVATADIAAGAVTAAKTSGVIGSIPSGSATSTTYATIWVE